MVDGSEIRAYGTGIVSFVLIYVYFLYVYIYIYINLYIQEPFETQTL